MSRKIPTIKTTPSAVKNYHKKNIDPTGKNIIPPLNRSQVLARLDWLGAMIPLYASNKRWFKWAVDRVGELNERLRMCHN